MLIASTALQIAGGLLFLIKLVTYPKFKDFLDWVIWQQRKNRPYVILTGGL